MVSKPDPTKSLSLLVALFEYLVDPGRGGWLPHEIHLLGFAQGGSCAAEAALAFSRKHPPTPERPRASLGSLVVISAPLLSLPTLDAKKRSTCPILLFLRAGEEMKGRAQVGADVEGAFRKGFDFVERTTKFSTSRQAVDVETMPQGQDEWRPILA